VVAKPSDLPAQIYLSGIPLYVIEHLPAAHQNRTLTGSSSAQVASTNELNAELRSPRAHVHHLTKLRRRLLVYFVGALAAAAALYMILSQLVATYAVHIAVTTPNQLTQADASTYEQAIDSYYAARPAERLRTLLNSDALLRHVQALQPEIKAISIEPSGGFGQATVEITPREPLARWSIAGSTQYVEYRRQYAIRRRVWRSIRSQFL